MPSGILYPDGVCIIGNGVVVDPIVLLREISQLRERGIEPKNLVVSERAHMVMSYHPLFDQLEEDARGDDRLGTTWRGIGPAYADKVRRIGFRIGDLQKEAFMRKKLAFVDQVKNPILTKLYEKEAYDGRGCWRSTAATPGSSTPTSRTRSRSFRTRSTATPNPPRGRPGDDAGPGLRHIPVRDELQPDRGGGAHREWDTADEGRPHARCVQGLHVASRLRPIPSELLNEVGDQIRERGHEFGTVTGRPRRIGWFDAAIGRYSARPTGSAARP